MSVAGFSVASSSLPALRSLSAFMHHNLTVSSFKPDSSYIVAGNMRSFSDDSAAMIYQLKSNGDSVWSARLQGFVSHERTSLQKSVNNSFTLCYANVNSGDTVIGIVAQRSITEVAAGYAHSLILKTDGTLWACGYDYCGQLGDGQAVINPTPFHIVLP